MILLIDNYDSFSYNLVHCVETLGRPVKVARNDEISCEEIEALAPEAIILSPGPSSPENAGICMEAVRRFAGRIPILGVCLGMQSIAQAMGGRIVRARRVMHGKVSRITHNSTGVFRGLPSPVAVVRYHSLAADRASLPPCFEITAEAEDGEIMGIRHRDFPLEGVQFHPESIMTSGGKRMIANFIGEAAAGAQQK